MKNKIILILSILLISSCSDMARKLKGIGKPPSFSDITFPEDSASEDELRQQQEFERQKRVYNEALKQSMMQKTQTDLVQNQSNSLWVQGSRDFFRGKKAKQVGDVLKVNISIAGDKASLNNSSSNSRSTSDVSSGAENVLGLDERVIPKLKQLLGVDFDLTSLVSNVIGSGKNNNTGQINRTETVQTQVAALVTKILPNGNLVIQAHQEIRVNHELREIMVSGIIRSDDIDANNTINIEHIAEARVSYGGRGMISDVQAPKYGTQLLDILTPF